MSCYHQQICILALCQFDDIKELKGDKYIPIYTDRPPGEQALKGKGITTYMPYIELTSMSVGK